MRIAVCENSPESAERLRGWIQQFCALYQVPAVLMYRAGAIQEGDPGYEEFLDDLYYAGGVCAYVLDLRGGGKDVELGDRSLGEVDTFEKGLERGRKNVRTTLKR